MIGAKMNPKMMSKKKSKKKPTVKEPQEQSKSVERRIKKSEIKEEYIEDVQQPIKPSKVSGLTVYFSDNSINTNTEVDKYLESIIRESESDLVSPVVIGDFKTDDLKALVLRVLDNNVSEDENSLSSNDVFKEDDSIISFTSLGTKTKHPRRSATDRRRTSRRRQ